MGLVLATVGSGCRKPTASVPTSQPAKSYDPATDPLVNPKSLFEPPPEDETKIATDETLYLQLDGSPNTLSPLFQSSLYESTVISVLGAGPFTFDKDMAWKIDEGIADPESFTESEDHTTFTIRLREGLRWHDGSPLTAHDIAYSWEQIMDDRVPCPAIKPGTDEIKECVAVDDLTVKYVMKEPLATSRWNMLFPIIPKHIYEKEKEAHPDLSTGDYYNQQARSPIGSGPYKFVEWKENDQIVVERWEDYGGKKPYFKRIVFRIIPDSNITLLSFQKGDVDAIRRLTPQQFARETNSETFRKVGYKAWAAEWSFGYIGWNMDGSNPFFGDVRVRKAMTHALNIPLVLDKVFYNLAPPCKGNYHPDSWMYNPEVKTLDFDLKQSADLLDEAGWTVDPGEGWRYNEKDGNRIRFEFTLLIPQGSDTSPKIAAIFQEDLKKVGVELKTRTLEWATFLEKVRKHEFQAEIAAWGTGTDPDTGWNLWRTEEYDKGRNFGGYSNARVDELFALGRKEFDFEKRKKIYQEIHKIIYDDQPYIWVFNSPTLGAISKRTRGVQFSPRGLYGFDPSFLGWWAMK
jgi:peptide/nickel transport system substrate-binding protein